MPEFGSKSYYMAGFENTTTLRLDLNIEAQAIAAQVMIDNDRLGDAMRRGINKGFEEIMSNPQFEEWVRDQTKIQLREATISALCSYEVRKRISDAVDEAILDIKSRNTHPSLQSVLWKRCSPRRRVYNNLLLGIRDLLPRQCGIDKQALASAWVRDAYDEGC